MRHTCCDIGALVYVVIPDRQTNGQTHRPDTQMNIETLIEKLPKLLREDRLTDKQKKPSSRVK